ncbi:MAG: LytR/AlgR family response regulator transcription factor [Bacteroidota bacterium]|jgi:DNA-binding LytR/AlgR family response regulator
MTKSVKNCVVKNIIRTVIIDDVPSVRQLIKKLLAHVQAIEVIGEATHADEAVRLITIEKPDLILLDVDLNGYNSLELLSFIKYEPMIVFITSHTDFALKAFEVNATDYLVKPIQKERLMQSLQKVITLWSGGAEKSTLDKAENKKLDADSKVMLDIDKKLVFVEVRHITHIVVYGNYTKVYTTDKRISLTYNSVKSWLSKLPPKLFIQINRSTLVNLEHISTIERWTSDTGRLTLIYSKEPFEVSRKFFFELKKRYKV